MLINILLRKSGISATIPVSLAPKTTCSFIFRWMIAVLVTTSCNKFVDIPSPDNKITTQELFKDDAGATSAVLGLYSQISYNGINIGSGAVTMYTGLASDELVTSSNTPDLKEFQANAITSLNSSNQAFLWGTAYRYIYQANACIEGITLSNGLSTKIRNQLLGECKVMRSLLYFYLTQLYGDVPLITSTDYNATSTLGRNSTKDIYNLILTDLTDAQKLMSTTYPSDGRLRPNSIVAGALLARVYLYLGQWQSAETEASNVINSQQYSLVSDLNKVFLAQSNEAIWQLTSVGGGINTREGATFVSASPSAIPPYLISSQLMSSFETNDPRKNAWVGIKTISNQTYYFPFKYKVTISFSNSAITENYMMLRLAEQYLIRAEAKIRQGKIIEGIDDLNTLRKRARGTNNAILQDLASNTTQETALSYVMQERKIELMAEWGNRWFDLKRLHRSGTELKPIKPGWQDTDTLFPIPSQEIIRNNKLTQNNGYN